MSNTPRPSGRTLVRDLKRSLNAALRSAEEDRRGLAQDAALRLLARSIDFGHGRLAVIRLAIAVKAGAEIPASHWQYCQRAASASRDAKLQDLLHRAADETHLPVSTDTP